MKRTVAILAGLSMAITAAAGVKFKDGPTVKKSFGKVKITFAVSGKTDVEVTVLDAEGKALRHLAAGVLGGENAPPLPLKPGLEQKLSWNGKDDFGKKLEGEGFKVRVRIGTDVKLEKFIGANPYNMGKIVDSASDEDGNVYVMGFYGQLNQRQLHLRVFDKDGNYLREMVPFPANVPDDGMGNIALWNEKRETYIPKQRSNLNPDFYGCRKKKPLELAFASKKKGVGLKGTRRYHLSPTGALEGYSLPEGVAKKPADLGKITAKQPAGNTLPKDWARLAIDYERDEVYVNDGCSRIWRFDGETGKGGLLMKGKRVFGVTDLSVGYDGLLYARTGRGSPNGGDYSGPFGRYTRDLEPAPYKESGTHILSKYIYSRYGVGYAERGIGHAPDGKVYISWMFLGWVKYGVTGFGADGKPLKGKYLVDKLHAGATQRGTPKDLNSAVIGPLPQAHGGVRVDWNGNIYVGMLYHPKDLKVPEGEDKMVWNRMIGGVLKFGSEGGYIKGNEAMMRGTEGEGILAYYPGFGPLSSAGFTENKCCVCRGARFDLDRWGRLVIPNAVGNYVRYVDNAGNLIKQFGKYGNFDSQYVNPNTKPGKKGKPTIAVPEFPMAWPTGAGFGKGHIYVLDTYARRVMRLKLAYADEKIVAVK